jgi:clan AA aspartic protease (TIGR02281 family)
VSEIVGLERDAMGDVIETLRRALGLVTMVAFLVGCATPAQRQYQAIVSGMGSEECRALQAVIEDRERYGIVARASDQDAAALSHCGLLRSGGPSPLQAQPSPSPQAIQEVKIERRGDTYRVPVRINDTITLPFLLDTGASDMVIPADVALTLVRAGALRNDDFIGKSRYQLANGSEEVSDVVVIREVQVGEHVVRNVTATISPLEGQPLLGQSFLSKFGTVTFDYKRLVLILSR